MKQLAKVLHDDEEVLVRAEIANTFYHDLVMLYALGALLLFVSYELEVGVIGIVLILRTFYVNLKEIKEKRSYHCVLTAQRLIILKGYERREVFPIELSEIRTIYIKPFSERLKNIVDVGALEVITTSGGRYVISHVKTPYLFHRAIIGDIVSATHYSNKHKILE